MVKSELIEQIAHKMSNLPMKDIELSVNQILESMSESLCMGGRIEIRHRRLARVPPPYPAGTQGVLCQALWRPSIVVGFTNKTRQTPVAAQLRQSRLSLLV